MSFKNLFYSSYWLKQPVIATKSVYYVWLILLLIIVAIGFGCLVGKIFVKNNLNKNILGKIGDMASAMGIVGLVLFFFRQQSVYLFGLRIWFLIWGVIFVAWAGLIAKYIFLRVPKIKAEQAEKARKEKYLP